MNDLSNNRASVRLETLWGFGFQSSRSEIASGDLVAFVARFADARFAPATVMGWDSMSFEAPIRFELLS